MKKGLFLLLSIIILILLYLGINSLKANVEVGEGYITFNNETYVVPNIEQHNQLNLFTPVDEDDLLGCDYLGGHYYKGKQDLDCNIIFYKGFGSTTYIKSTFSFPTLDECYIKQITITDFQDNAIIYDAQVSASEKFTILDIAMYTTINKENKLEFTEVMADVYFHNYPYIYINTITIYTNGDKIYMDVYGLDYYLEIKEEYINWFSKA